MKNWSKSWAPPGERELANRFDVSEHDRLLLAVHLATTYDNRYPGWRYYGLRAPFLRWTEERKRQKRVLGLGRSFGEVQVTRFGDSSRTRASTDRPRLKSSHLTTRTVAGKKSSGKTKPSRIRPRKSVSTKRRRKPAKKQRRNSIKNQRRKRSRSQQEKPSKKQAKGPSRKKREAIRRKGVQERGNRQTPKLIVGRNKHGLPFGLSIERDSLKVVSCGTSQRFRDGHRKQLRSFPCLFNALSFNGLVFTPCLSLGCNQSPEILMATLLENVSGDEIRLARRWLRCRPEFETITLSVFGTTASTCISPEWSGGGDSRNGSFGRRGTTSFRSLNCGPHEGFVPPRRVVSPAVQSPGAEAKQSVFGARQFIGGILGW